MTNYIFLAVIAALIIFLNKKLKNKSKIKTLKFTFINLIYIVSTMTISYGVSRVAEYLNGRDFSLTYLPLIKYEKGILIVCLILATIGL